MATRILKREGIARFVPLRKTCVLTELPDLVTADWRAKSDINPIVPIDGYNCQR